MLRALVHALTTQTALLKVNICQVVLKCDGVKRASLYALAATYAGYIASLLGNRALILIHATYVDASVHLVAVTQLNDITRASLYALAACGTFLLVHNRKSGIGIHLDGIKRADAYAVTAAQASIETAGLAAVHHVCYGAAFGTVITAQGGTVCTGT